jgi:hypothetical protein
VVNGTDTIPYEPPVAVPIVGACGTVVAVIELEAEVAVVVNPPPLAVAVNVYEVPDCKPVTVTGDVPLAVNPPGEDVTLYELGIPPVDFGVAVTVAAPLLYALPVPTFVAVPIFGGLSGTSAIKVPDLVNPAFTTFLIFAIFTLYP